MLLSLTATAVPLPDLEPQRILVLLNGAIVREFTVYGQLEHALLLPGRLLRADRENFIRFIYRHCAQPGQLNPGETRCLAVAFRSLRLEPIDLDLYPDIRLLPINTQAHDAESLALLAKGFQSLGQNCEFGLVQRRCGAEPMGLLRFASISMDNLLHGVRSKFAGIERFDHLHLDRSGPGGEFMVRHQTYGLDYHTFRYEGQIDTTAFMSREPLRLKFLARMLMEEIQSAFRTFVVQRDGWFLTDEQVLPLFCALRRHNANVRLLYVTAVGNEYQSLVGRVTRLAPGLFHGYVKRLAPADNAHDLELDPWIHICSSVAAVRSPLAS